MGLENENPDLLKEVEPDSPMKELIVEYVGAKKSPEDDNVTVEMVINTMADEFPEVLLSIAEENFIRGYIQGIEDKNSINENEWLYKKNFFKKNITLSVQ